MLENGKMLENVKKTRHGNMNPLNLNKYSWLHS